jgi:hypothetical protein
MLLGVEVGMASERRAGKHTLHVEPGFGDLGGYATQFRPGAPFPAAVLVEVHSGGIKVLTTCHPV